MKWEAFLQKKQLYEQAWNSLKDDFTGDDREFLDASYLVITYKHHQIDFSVNDVISIAMNSVFIIKDRNSMRLIELADEYKRVKDRNSELAKNVLLEMHKVDTKDIEIVNLRVEIRFPTVAMERIQRIKRSKYVDQELTDMTRVSIRVILKEV